MGLALHTAEAEETTDDLGSSVLTLIHGGQDTGIAVVPEEDLGVLLEPTIPIRWYAALEGVEFSRFQEWSMSNALRAHRDLMSYDLEGSVYLGRDKLGIKYVLGHSGRYDAPFIRTSFPRSAQMKWRDVQRAINDQVEIRGVVKARNRARDRLSRFDVTITPTERDIMSPYSRRDSMEESARRYLRRMVH